jgi:hypothetical protein
MGSPTPLDKAAKAVSPQRGRVRPTPRGGEGYDNVREVIDPHVRTKVIDTQEIIQGGVSYDLAGMGGGHARQHAINAAADHTGYGDSVTKSVGIAAGTVAAGDHNHTGVYAPVLGADDNYVTDVEKAALHVSGADVVLGVDCVAQDHGTAATDTIINVCYGTGAEPAANTTTEGTIYIKYTA